MTLNEFIDQLTHKRDLFNAANFTVLIDPEGDDSNPQPTVEFDDSGKGTVWV